MASFEIVSDVTEIEVIAVGNSIRDLPRLRKLYGDGRWRKMKGIATSNLQMDAPEWPNFTGMKRTASDGKNISASAIWHKT